MLTKPRNTKSLPTSLYSPNQRRRISPLMLIGLVVTVLVALGGVSIFVVLPRLLSHAAATPNPNCTLIVPPNPLSAQGLATPYQLVATDPANGPCNEANPAQSAFVQADILNPFTGQITTYDPLVIDQGTQPAVAPTPPQLPPRAVVGIWFGDNGNVLTLLKQNAQAAAQGNNAVPTAAATPGSVAAPAARSFFPQFHIHLGGNMASGNCVNGLPNSPFGQFAYCNAPNFFRAATIDILLGKTKIPPLGTAKDGKPCPTTRDFSIVDMDQSDNVQTQYLANGNGQTAQFSAANQAQIQNAVTISNPSDNALLSRFVDPALQCTAWQVPDLANNNTPVATYGTDELQAAFQQRPPVALVPAGDPMVLNNNQPSLTKTNLYRAGADQFPAFSLNRASTTTYCKNLVNVALPRLQLDTNLFQNQPSPDGGATANSLFTFLANRLNATFSANGLNCVGLLNIQNPIALTTDGNGVVTAATITTKPLPANAGTAVTPTTTTGNTGTGMGAVTPTTTTGNGTVQNSVSGRVSAILDTNAGNVQVALNMNLGQPNMPFFLNVGNSCGSSTILHQMENSDGTGQNNASTVINGQQGLKNIPNTWVASITDGNNNILGCAPFTSNGATATATFVAGTPTAEANATGQ